MFFLDLLKLLSFLPSNFGLKAYLARLLSFFHFTVFCFNRDNDPIKCELTAYLLPVAWSSEWALIAFLNCHADTPGPGAR